MNICNESNTVRVAVAPDRANEHNAKAILLSLMIACMVPLSGCTSVSLGDPETSTADAALVGWWKTSDEDGSHDSLNFRVYDKRTLLANLWARVKLNADERGNPRPVHLVAKTWITKLNNGFVLSAEIIDPASDTKDDTTRAKRFAHFKIAHAQDSLIITPMAEGAIEDVHSPQELADRINEKWDDRRFWAVSNTFVRTTPPNVIDDQR